MYYGFVLDQLPQWDVEIESLGVRLRRLRNARGMSQEALARRAGITKQAVYLLETGRRSRMLEDTRDCLAEALDVSSVYLETGMEPADSSGGRVTLDSVLRQNRMLSEADIEAVRRIVEGLEARAVLAGDRRRAAETPATYEEEELPPMEAAFGNTELAKEMYQDAQPDSDAERVEDEEEPS